MLKISNTAGATGSNNTYYETVTITDSNNAQSVVVVTVTINKSLTGLSYVSPFTSNAGFARSETTTTVSGGTGAYAYSLTGTGANSRITINSSSGLLTITSSALVSDAGTYAVTVTDSLGSTLSTNVTIAINLELSFGSYSTLVSAEGNSASQTGTASGGSSPYSWSIVNTGHPAVTINSSGTVNLSNSIAIADTGTYTVRVTDSFGDSRTATITLNIYPVCNKTTSISLFSGSFMKFNIC